MSVIDWMRVHVRGFSDLAVAELEAAMHFSLLWSYFEADTLDNNASAAALTRWIGSLGTRLHCRQFDPALAYFRDRYFASGDFTAHFHDLHLRRTDRPELVEAVVRGDNRDPVDGVVAVFIIVYRFRNNFFHGLKWGDFLRGQQRNFEVASQVLMLGVEL